MILEYSLSVVAKKNWNLMRKIRNPKKILERGKDFCISAFPRSWPSYFHDFRPLLAAVI